MKYFILGSLSTITFSLFCYGIMRGINYENR